MNSPKAQSQKKEINYENIPTQLNEKIKEVISKKYYKEKILNSRYMNNMHNFPQKKTFDFVNINHKEYKKNRNKSIKSYKEIYDIINSPSIKRSIKSPRFKKANIRKLVYTPDKKQSNKITRKNKFLNINNYIIKKEDDFLKRQTKYSAKKITNIKKLTKEISLLRSSSKRNNKDCFSTNNVNNASFISSKSMAEIECSISKLYEWEKRRKEKIKEMQEKKDKEHLIYSYIPKIDKRSNTLAKKSKLNNNNSNENIFERLSKGDSIYKERKKILMDIYKPSFQPEIYYSNRNRYHSRSQKNIEKKEKNYEYVIKVNRINKKQNSSVDSVDIEEKNEKDDVLHDILRKTIIKNIHNKFRNNSAERRKIMTHLL